MRFRALSYKKPFKEMFIGHQMDKMNIVKNIKKVIDKIEQMFQYIFKKRTFVPKRRMDLWKEKKN